MSRAGETVNKQLIQNGATIAQWIRHHAVLGSNLKHTLYAFSISGQILYHVFLCDRTRRKIIKRDQVWPIYKNMISLDEGLRNVF